MGKRYYWLKLQDGFFSSKRIKKLRRMGKGDTYVIIYLKLQLLSISKDGTLKWIGLEDDAAKEFALDIDEDPDDVATALQYLLDVGLVESDGVTFRFPWAIENTGSEGASAKRWRDWRDRQALDSNAQLTPSKRFTNGDKEIEKEIEEKEIYKEKDRGGVHDTGGTACDLAESGGRFSRVRYDNDP